MGDGYEIPRGQRLYMRYAGAKWMRDQLGYAKGRKVGGRLVRDEMSPLGETVADVLGYVYRGLYHLDNEALLRADWWDGHSIKVAVNPDLSSWDYNELTQLVVVCHDLGLRVAINPHGPRRLSLIFHQRTTRDPNDGLFERCPTMDDHVAMIRSGYSVVPPESPSNGGQDG